MRIEKAGVPEHLWGQRPLFQTHKHMLRWKPRKNELNAEQESYLEVDDTEQNWDVLLDNDEMQPEEAAFMRGWDDAR
ncbi:MAG: hypothetical protein Q7R76_03150 [Candidatus Woesearchaeota archaeon]|nr:hypothetical protein [Candidatus Woesearchaeota archaeon]